MIENKTVKTIITIITSILLVAFFTYVDIYFYKSMESDGYGLWLLINFCLYVLFFVFLMDGFYGKEEASEDLDDNEE